MPYRSRAAVEDIDRLIARLERICSHSPAGSIDSSSEVKGQKGDEGI